ncbi:hypothetical protein M426DRAFT_77076 [Hypoxylon sp. CI-4A]|nr:hypothetical protein M426DRAFT_77076 [Hypoxylon sp. CI-4A]
MSSYLDSDESDSSEQEDPTDEISEELGRFLDSRASTFTCRGSIPIVTLPLVDSDADEKARFAALVNDCQPATFGYQGKDVYDETYRKATKLDSSEFSTSFCPYSVGIIDTITQFLLPDSPHKTSGMGVEADLYKLNVIYSAPFGMFKAHVDTPRSKTQFGSLVVSLPCHHEGGQLVVSHRGVHSAVYDWTTASNEVKGLTEGHRLTLTYNLSAASGVGQLAGDANMLDVYNLPLHKKVEEALANPDFMPGGGHLGFHCTHAYPHTTKVGQRSLPGILKGVDMAVYNVFDALGLKVRAKTVLDGDEADKRLEVRYGWDEEKEEAIQSRLGNWGGIRITEKGGGETDGWGEILDEFSTHEYGINWLTAQKEVGGGVGFVHLAYGNEPDVEYWYVYAVLLIDVPAADERGSAQETE